MKININADMGESWGPFTIGSDKELLDIIGSANIACGAHAGDPRIMDVTLRAAKERNVSVGAHPGYRDMKNFGRLPVKLDDDELKSELWAQIGSISAIGLARGIKITHVKPHGALNNQASADPHLARIIAEAIANLDSELILLAPVFSHLAKAGHDAGLRVALEVFADRTYEPDGQLTPRSIEGSTIHNAAQASEHVKNMIETGGIICRDNSILKTDFHSICVHGDGKGAVEIAHAVHSTVQQCGYEPSTLPETLLR